MIKVEHQIVIIAYLAEKLRLDEEWYLTPLDTLFNSTPQEVVMRGDGDILIEYLEVRLGLRAGSAF